MVTSLTLTEFVNHVSSQNHAMAGATIAISAAQAAGLGEACLRITWSLGNRNKPTIESKIGNVSQIKQELLNLGNKDAGAIAEFVALREAGDTLSGQKMLCHLPTNVGTLSVQAASILQNSRPFIHERVQDDLEMSIRLLFGTAQAALLLLDSNLRIWPDAALVKEFEPLLENLEREIEHLEPVRRIRHSG